MEPQTDDANANDYGNHHEAGFAMKFAAHILPVEIKPRIIPPLLARARAIFDATDPPLSRDGCTDCKLFEELIRYV